MADSIFTQIIQGKIPSHKIYEDDQTYAFLDIHPITPGDGLFLTSTKQRVWLDIDPATAQAYAKELAAKRDEQLASIKRLESRLKNKDYVKNAPAQVVEQTRQQLADAQALLASLEKEQKQFS